MADEKKDEGGEPDRLAGVWHEIERMLEEFRKRTRWHEIERTEEEFRKLASDMRDDDTRLEAAERIHPSLGSPGPGIAAFPY